MVRHNRWCIPAHGQHRSNEEDGQEMLEIGSLHLYIRNVIETSLLVGILGYVLHQVFLPTIQSWKKRDTTKVEKQ